MTHRKNDVEKAIDSDGLQFSCQDVPATLQRFKSRRMRSFARRFNKLCEDSGRVIIHPTFASEYYAWYVLTLNLHGDHVQMVFYDYLTDNAIILARLTRNYIYPMRDVPAIGYNDQIYLQTHPKYYWLLSQIRQKRSIGIAALVDPN